MRIYLDASPVISFIEQEPILATLVQARLSEANVEPVASSLTRLECLVRPMRDGNAALLQDFEDFFDGTLAVYVSLTDDIMNRATQIRSQHAIKTPDGIHLAAAELSACDVFLTNDQRLASLPDITVEIIEP